MESGKVQIIKFRGEPYVGFEDMMKWLRGVKTFDNPMGNWLMNSIELNFRRAIAQSDPLHEVTSA